MAKNWMSKAFANSHGQFKAQAKKHHMGTEAYANKVSASPSASTHVKRQANLVKIARGVNHTGHKHGS